MNDKQKVIISNGVRLVNFDLDTLEQIRIQTSFTNPAYEEAAKYSPWGPPKGIPQRLYFSEYDAQTHEMVLHRGAYSFLSPAIVELIHAVPHEDDRTRYLAKFPKLRVTLNEEQVQCMDAMKKALADRTRPFGNMLFLASTAAGKTILQAAAAAYLRHNTLIICPTVQILRAWYSDLYKAFGLKPSQLGLIRGGSFKIVPGFTLAMFQTLGRRETKWPELNDLFGTVVVDEVQMVSAPTLFNFLKQSPAKYLIGATATQEARKGINLHLRALMGQPLIYLNTYGRDTAASMSVTGVKLVATEFKFTHQIDNIDWYELGMAILTDEERNKLIIKNVQKEWLDNRVILIVTKLREHVTVLYEMLLEAGITDVNQITGSTNANRFYTTRLLKAISKRSATCIVATQQAIKLGTNIPVLDSLHIAIPSANRRDFEQLIGRIRRKAEGKKQATVTYYMDTHVGYLMHIYRKVVVPTFQKLNLQGLVTG